MEEQAKEVAALLQLLANKNRLLILCALLERSMEVGELAKFVPGISRPALSQHLHTLLNAGLLANEKNGQYVRYSIHDERIRAVFTVLKEQYCS